MRIHSYEVSYKLTEILSLTPETLKPNTSLKKEKSYSVQCGWVIIMLYRPRQAEYVNVGGAMV